MNLDQQCPTMQKLSELMDGRMVEPDLSRFSGHLEECSHCQGKVRTISSRDTLVEILRTTSHEFENIIEETPQHLLDRLKQIPLTASKGSMNGARFVPQSPLSFQSEYSVFSPPENQDEIGQFGDYRILSELGRGGMGVVFRAEEIPLQRMVAIKIMSQRIASLPEAKERFLKEAKAAASLKSDHIVTIYRVDEFSGVPFVAMELLQGESMEASLKEGEAWSLPRILQTAIDIARGLADAHSKGMIHRDIKPGNLWLETTAHGTRRTKILDFGLVRSELDDMQKTMTGTIVGTPAFMSPEQARGDKGLDARADLFSLGCVLYRLSTGELPFKSETTLGTLMALATHNPVAPAEINAKIPCDLSKLIIQMLQKDPQRRPPSARFVIERLEFIAKNLSNHSGSARAKNGNLNLLTKLAGSYRGWLAIPAVALAIVSMFDFAGTFYWQTEDGKIVRIESNDPSISIAIQDGELKVAGAYSEPLTVKPGKVDLQISKKQANGEDFQFETNKLVVRKGDVVTLRIETLDGKIAILQEGKGLVDQVELPVVPSFEKSPDRTAANWVLSIGGRIEINRSRWISSASDLPSEPFGISQINLEGNPGITKEGLASLVGLQQLVFLDLEGSSINDECLKPVGQVSGLTQLNLYGTKITDAGLQHLKDLRELKEIGLGGGIPITDKGASVFKNFPKLQNLYLDATEVTDETIETLKGLEELIDINVAGTRVTTKGIKQLTHIKSLRRACFLSTPLDDETLETLVTKNTEFEQLHLGATRVTDKGLELLYPLKNLRTLWLVHNHHSDEAIAKLHAKHPDCRIYLTDRTLEPKN